MSKEKKEHLLSKKIIYTIMIMLVYMVGKNLPLYGIDMAAYMDRTIEAEDFLLNTISGDLYQCSIFALGISPYMISSIVVQIISACRSSETRSKVSPKKMNYLMLAITFFAAVFQAFVQIYELQFDVPGNMLSLVRGIAGLEMVTGVMIILWLASRNKKYGIGGQSILIFVNVMEGIMANLKSREMSELAVPLTVALAVVIIMIIMENAEKRIPVQRISIHNIYADKNYLAIKLNPIGVMPAMFSTAFFILPQLIISGLLIVFPNHADILWWQDNMSLSKPLGIIVYIVILYCLTIGFSLVFVNPKELTEQFLKSGDSLLDIHAGRDTRRYLTGVVGRLSFFSASVMSLCLGVPLYLQVIGSYEGSLVMLPASVMMLTGIWCNIYREGAAVKNLEAYKPFI